MHVVMCIYYVDMRWHAYCKVHMYVDMHIVCAYECRRVYIVIVILTQITPHTKHVINDYT